MKESYFNKFRNFQYNQRSYVVQKRTIVFPNDSNHVSTSLERYILSQHPLFTLVYKTRKYYTERSEEQTRKNARLYDAR